MCLMLEAALQLIRDGFAVFPLQPGTKLPFAGSRGCKDATKDEAQVRQWWTDTPQANIGIATGKPSGVWVLDIDGDRGKESLKK
jgi:hypothetical protein